MTTHQGRFITLEGIEGVGKTTHLHTVCALLRQEGYPVLATREPGGTAVGEAVREILLHGENMHAETELLLMFAARAEHLNQLIRPALACGEWVVSDRFTDASYAYQGGGRNLALQRIAALEQWLQGDLRPDLVLVFDAPVETALQRAKQRGENNRFEQERYDFFERARRIYLERAQAMPERYSLINAAQPLDAVSQQITTVLLKWSQKNNENSFER